MDKSKEKQIKAYLPKVVVGMLIAIGLLWCLFSYQLYQYEEGILDVYSKQQDAYVQLVLDQINLKENRMDEEIINDILYSLDASTNKYWTFSKTESMLFVKDVVETNKYMGITAESYYSERDAKDFLDNLKLNLVTHRNITISDKTYIASGVAFEYKDSIYKLCLLTNRDVLLDNNMFLGSKVLISTVIGVILIFSFLIISIVVRKYVTIALKNLEIKNDNMELQKSIENLNERLAEKNANVTRQRLWNEELLPDFIRKLNLRENKEVAIVSVIFETKEARNDMLNKASVTLDEAVLRFSFGENNVIIIGIGSNVEDIMWGIRPCLDDKCKIGKTLLTDSKHLDMNVINDLKDD